MGNATNHRSGKVSLVRFASAGHYFTHATEAGQFRARTPGTYDFKNASVVDYADRPWMDAVDVDIKFPWMQTSFPAWNNAHLLSAAPHNIDIVTPESEHFAFVPTTNNDYVTPNGSEMVGMTYLFKIPNKGGRTIDMNWKVTLFDTQEQWIYSNTSIVPAGGSGGSDLGLTAETYDPTEFRASNFIYALYDGTDMGFFADGISLQLQSVGETLHRGQTFSEFLTATLTLVCTETAASQLLSRSQNNNLDKTIQIYTRYNEQINFINGSIRPERSFGWDDKNGVRKVTLVFKGTIPYPKITINTSTKVATFDLA